MLHPVFSRLFIDITYQIDIKICEEEQELTFFAEYNKKQLNCDERLTKDEIIYFEDLVAFFYKVIAKAVEDLYYCDCKIVKTKTYLQ